MNLSQQKRQRMLEFLSRIREEHKDDDATLIALNEIESELNSKKYGLVWEEHEEAVDVQMRTHIPVFTEDTSMEIAALPDGDYNFLLEGDNLHSLYLLEKTHKGRIDVIFIDPPYNTGNKDFIYDDTFIDKQDGYLHSKWISFMCSRLQSAKYLLAEDGVIYICIDDNEQANLKLLCDSIFGEENFLANIIWQHSIQPKGYAGTFSVHHNYLLCYQKSDKFKLNQLPRKDEDNKAYSNPDNDPRGPWRSGDVRNALYRPNLIYDIVSPSGKIIKPCSNGWRWSKETVAEKIQTGEIIFSADETRIIRKIYLDTLNGRTPETIWFGKDEGTTRSAMSEIKAIFGESAFGTPKPSSLVMKALQLHTNKNALVLDFFAGSGTTAQAVLELNKQDGGSRRFILCTNNENNICEEVTYQRIKTVITGKRKDGSVYSEGIPANLKYYRTDFVARDEEYLSEALLEHIAEMIQLENGVKIDGSKYIMVLDEEEADELAKNWASYPDVKAIYAANDILFTTEQAELFAGTEINIIPDYYFEFELREEGETW